MMPCALVLALANAGNSSPASIAMMAITTKSSMSVNATRYNLFPRGVTRFPKMSFFINVSWFLFSLYGLLVLKFSLLLGRRQHFGSRALRPSLFRIVNRPVESA